MEKFTFLSGVSYDPQFNIASEEYLLKQKTGYYIYLWQNDKSVIVGVNQNPIAEVNFNFTESNKIKVVRRLTGGGAVYHDLNNLCYTVIAPFDKHENAFEKFTKPVIEYLNALGVNATLSGRNDIVVENKKISGNAKTVFGDRVMLHGTLLFDTDMDNLTGALKANKLKMQSKGIKSVRSRVTNIKTCLNGNMNISAFINGLSNYLKKDCIVGEFTKEDIESINKLKNDKYSTFNWNIGYYSKCANAFEYKFDFGVFNLNFDIDNGKILNATVYGDFFSKGDIKEFAKGLNGVRFEKQAVLTAFERIEEYIENADYKQIVNKIFE